MKLASYELGDRRSVGIVLGDRIIDVRSLDASAPSVMRELVAWPTERLQGLEQAATQVDVDTSAPLAEVTLLPVVPDPHAIWCAALSYLSHVQEGGDRPVPDFPVFFLRLPDSQVGHGQRMLVPAVSEQLDYEGELAVIIGRGGRHIAPEDARQHIAGYACYNEGSVRDWQRHTSQITPGKNFADSGAFGPWLVTADEFGDPYEHTMITRLNGEVMQSARISELLFRIEDMVSYLSTIHRLEPGDVIVTGTSGGVGIRRDPVVFLRPGDVVEVEIDGIGTLRNPVAAEEAPHARRPVPRSA
ncbi:fumarylacetoacetate hydrolase family protein [Microbacterium sp. CPCC 204701]|uniref:fumarylacetoacetate hydrolase family protein n=1 Tax=Microbacterium sp. CPCC 204701 TaxID=2493084 RepID=UPI000FD9C1EF|nr:fumarylacetoacetate hydrolase family protein [Microbacterium sp. CPCC 204701]